MLQTGCPYNLKISHCEIHYESKNKTDSPEIDHEFFPLHQEENPKNEERYLHTADEAGVHLLYTNEPWTIPSSRRP